MADLKNGLQVEDSDVEICIIDEDEQHNEKSVKNSPEEVKMIDEHSKTCGSSHSNSMLKEDTSDKSIVQVRREMDENTSIAMENDYERSIAASSGEDSDDEDSQYDEDTFNRFSFESDHLAFKHNKDYKMLLKNLLVLEAQRISSIKDLEDLHSWRDKALRDPISFVESLQSKDPPKLPGRNQVASPPTVDWMQYLTSADLMKFPAGFNVNTRKSFRSKGESSHSEVRIKSENIDQEDNESVASGSSLEQSKFVRGRLKNENKVMTFNRLWTTEEQEKLEKLLLIYPPEDVEARRWEKIARALGNRTSKQVSSRVQKYFIKLARAGLPIPGRVPHLTSQRKAKMNPVSYRNSTFFPSWKPSVYMNDDDDDDASSITTAYSDDTPYASDEETIPTDLKDSAEYKELIKLKRYKRDLEENTDDLVHKGFMCDSCGMEPIQGVRWHCLDCPADSPISLCNNCKERNPQNLLRASSSTLHDAWHRMTAVEENSSFVDGDYMAFELQQGKYNYLDPNFRPKSK